MSNTRCSKKKQLLNTMAINLGCNCTFSKLSSIFNPKPKTHLSHHHHHYSTSNPSTTTNTSRTASSSSPFMAVEKDSVEPYLDFRASMMQMIVENEIYTKEDLRNLLTCFLQLNSPSLHGVIITAFTDIWNTLLFSTTSSTTPHLQLNGNARRRRRRNPNHTSRPPKAYVRPKSYKCNSMHI